MSSFAPRLALACLLAIGALGAPRADADEFSDDEIASWLFGTWTATMDDVTAQLVLAPDGTFTAPMRSKELGAGSFVATWAVKDGAIALFEHGAESMRMQVERLPAQDGKRRARFVTPAPGGTPPTWVREADVERDPSHPEWLAGTWAPRDQQRSLRQVLEPDGAAALVMARGVLTRRDAFEWRVEEDRFFVRHGKEDEAHRLVRLFDVDGRPRMRLVAATEAAAQAPVFERLPGPVRGSPQNGPIVGCWVRRDGLPRLALDLLPDGRYERRRFVSLEGLVEPGTYTVAQGATGLVVKLTSAAGAERDLEASIAGDRLRLHDPRGETSDVELERTTADAAAIARRSAARWPDEVLEFERQFETQRLTPDVHPDPAAIGKLEDAASDPHPADVLRGMLAFSDVMAFRRESEALVVRDATTRAWIDARAADGRGLPETVAARSEARWVFLPHGRFFVVEASRSSPAAAVGERVVRRGKYAVEASVVLVEFDGGEEDRLRIADGGRFLHLGREILQDVDDAAGTRLEERR